MVQSQGLALKHYKVTYHLIDDTWRRIDLPSAIDVDFMSNLTKLQLWLKNKKVEKTVLLEDDGSGWISRPVDTINRYVSPEEMLMIQLSTED